MRFFVRLFSFLLALSAFALGGTCAHAAAEVQTSIAEYGVFDTNPQMLSRDAQTIRGSTTAPEISFTGKDDTTLLSASGKINANVFDKSDYDSTDFYGDAALTQKNERWEARLSGKAAYDTTRTTETTLLGVNVGNVRHLVYTIAPGVTFSPSPRDRISLDGSFQNANYMSDAYTDYALIGLNPGYTRALTPLTSALLGLQIQRYQAESGIRRKIDSVGPTAGFLTALLPELTLRANAGAAASKESGGGLPDGDWQWDNIFSGSLTYKDETDNASLQATRQREPLSNGADVITTTFALDGTHSLSENLALTFGASYKYANHDDRAGRNLDSLASGQAGLSYRLLRNLELSGLYRYRVERFKNGDGDAEQNMARVGLTYRPDWDNLLN